MKGSPTVTPPAPRNLTSELQQTYQGYAATAPGYLALEKTYEPQYAALGQQIQQQLQPGNIALTSRNRAADITDVMNMGPAAMAAYLRANPWLANSVDNLSGRLDDSALLRILNQQSIAALQNGGRLTANETQTADNQVRSAYADRGLLNSPGSAGAELLNLDSLQRQRTAAAQQFGTTVQGLNTNQADLVGRATQIFGTQLADPVQTILNRPSGAGGGGGVGGSTPIGSNTRLFDPTNPYAADIYNTNYNAQAAANIANANNQAASQNSTMSTIGTIAGAALLAFSDERLKERKKKIGHTTEMIPVYEWSYKGDKRRFVSPMARDIEKIHPEAVATMPLTGHKLVDFSQIDAPFYESEPDGQNNRKAA